MKAKTFIIISLLATGLLLTAACDDFLDVAPDNRVDLSDVQNNAQMLTDLLINGYPDRLSVATAELMSDNADHKINPPTLTYHYLWNEEAYYWKNIENDQGNDDIGDVWTAHVDAIAAANVVLDAIAKAGYPEEVNAQRGEALMIRAYNHFMLVNLFGQHYNPATAATDLGVPYWETQITELDPKFVRLSVAEVYEKIDRDIEEGLPLIDESLYGATLKYHFNKRASYAFATRFNLYYGNYDKVIAYANTALGENLATVMKDKKAIGALPRDFAVYAQAYSKATNPANFLVMSPTSNMAQYYGNYSTCGLYKHSYLLAYTETVRSNGPWGNYYTSPPYTFNIHSSTFSSGTYCSQPKHTYGWTVTNVLTGAGVARAEYVAFSAEETLLCRAEAYIVKGEYDKATDDLAVWMRYHCNSARVKTVLTRDLINSYYSAIPYYDPFEPTVKKKLNPLNFTIREDGEMENFLACMLHFRRIETIHDGLRWFDVKRFGIEIYRRDVDNKGGSSTIVDSTTKIIDKLELNDYRRAMQIPYKILIAGMEPNPGYPEVKK
jgi:hypothetical protein